VETSEAMADALNRQEWDLVISDYSMPFFGGLEALKLLQEKDPDLSFILLTGQVGEDVAVEAMKAGAHDYILKSNPARLIPAVERELRDTRARRKNRQNEQALRESRERYRLIVENANEGIWYVDESNRTTFVNQKMADMMGYTIDEMVGQTPYTFMDEEWGRVSETRLYKRSLGISERCEHKYQRKDGTDLWAFISAAPIFRDDGSYAGSIGMVSVIPRRGQLEGVTQATNDILKITSEHTDLAPLWDITKRKQVEDALRQSEEKDRTIFKATGTAAMIIEEDTTISLINQEFEALSGYSKEEIEGKKSWKEFYTEDFLGDMLRYHNLRRVDLDSAPKQYEARFIARGGDVRQVIVTVSMIPGTNQNIAFLLDISRIKQAEQATRQSEEKFRALFEQAPVGIGITRDGKMQMANQSYLDVFGYANVTELEGTFLLDRVAPQCRSQVEEIVMRKERGEAVPRAYETVGVRRDGSQFPLYVESARIELPDGPAIIAYLADFTDSKDAQALRDKYIILSTYSRDIILYARRSDGGIIEANEAAAKEYGYSREELLGMAIHDLRAEDERQFVDEQMRRADERGIAFETYYLRKDGSTFPAEVSAQGVTIKGEHIYLSIIRNITQRNRADEELRSAHQQLAQIIEFLPDATFVIDGNRKVIAWNRAIEEMTGVGKESILGKNDYAYAVPFSGEPRPSLIDLFLGDSNSNALKYEYMSKTDTAIYARGYVPLPYTHQGGGAWLWGAASPLVDDEGQTIGAIESIRDITEQKKAEEELKKYREHLEGMVQRRTAELTGINKELESFSYSVSHDLRAPLRIIDGYSKILEEDCLEKLGDEDRKNIQIIRGQCQRMGDLINALFDLSRLTRKEMHLEEVSLSQLAENITVELQRMAPERRVDFIIASGLKVWGDRILLQSVLENLINNSWKFTSQHGQAKIEFGAQEHEGKKVYFVRDDGAGFNMRYAQKLFGAFQRLHKVGEFPGTGVGLATVQRIVHRHGGQVWAEGAEKKGASFYFTLHSTISRMDAPV
jgi:PAS domain S-box-containing protein